jgi:UPF0755 protein
MLLFCCACGRRETQPTTTAQPEPNTVRVTFPEGKTVLQIAQLLEENGVCSAASFLQAVAESDADYAVALRGQDRPFLLEGYVFPDTYEFYKNESASMALSRFLTNFAQKFTEKEQARAREIGLTMDETLTLASIIQAEAGVPSEMPKVSSVLHNRLQRGMKLQCDVTYFYLENTVMPYLCPDGWDDAVYEKYADLYYTYRVSALPQGAICNPGSDAIAAALYPADTDDLYFVTDEDGNYYYSPTYEAHQKICREIGR